MGAIAILLQDERDARQWLSGIFPADYLPVSTHPVVNEILALQGATCAQFADFLAEDDYRVAELAATDVVDDMLARFDQLFSRRLQELCGLDVLIPWFAIAYGYRAVHELIHLRLSAAALRQLQAANGITEIVLTHHCATGLFSGAAGALEILSRKRGMRCTIATDTARQMPTRYQLGLTKRVRRAIRFHLDKMRARRADILLFGAPYDLPVPSTAWPGTIFAVAEDVANTAVILTEKQRTALAGIAHEMTEFARAGEETCEQILEVALVYDFSNRAESMARALVGMQLLLHRGHVRLAVWGNGPGAVAEKSLCLTYMRRQGIPVAGMQHGLAYVEYDTHWQHHRGEYRFCDFYLTYGFTDTDMRMLYPQNPPACNIIPVGRPLTAGNKQRQPIDVLYVPNNAVAMLFYRQCGRAVNAVLARTQWHIVFELKQAATLNRMVKMMPGSTTENSALIAGLMADNAGLMVRDEPLQEILREYAPRLVILDHLSATLADILLYAPHSQIILFRNASAVQYNPPVLAALAKRLYFADTEESFSALFQQFIESKLAELRSEEYMRHYCHASEGNEGIFRAFHRIIESAGKSRTGGI